MNDDEELLAVFQAEVGEALGTMDELLARRPERWDLEQLFHVAHNVKGASRMTGIDAMSAIAHALEDLFSALRAGLAVDEQIAARAREGAALLVATFDAAVARRPPPDHASFPRAVSALLDDATPEPRVDDGVARHDDELAPEGRELPMRDTVRIALDKVESLMALVVALGDGRARADGAREEAAGIARRIERLRRDRTDRDRDEVLRDTGRRSRDLARYLADEAARSGRLIEQIEDAVRRLRMVRVESLRAHLRRVARTAAASCGRDVHFAMEGGDTEIDRAVLDGLRDPLVHLVRNAVAHGIEPAAERAARKKSARGRVTVSARAAGSWVEITVRDDGGGIDLEKVRARAVARGLLAPDAAPSRDDLLALAFRPGFSTSDAVTEIAGRGFGMDIARANLAELGGIVELRSFDGLGTEVLLRAPLTRLTTRVLVVRAGKVELAVPMLAVERTLLVARGDVRVADGTDVVLCGGELLAIGALASALGLPDAAQERRPALVLADGQRRRAYLVDEVLGERDLTLHALPWSVAGSNAIAGAAVDGAELLLVLDAPELVAARGGRGLDRAATPAGAERRRRVLVVDDSVTSRTLEKNILGAAGYEVLTAVDGAAAFDLLRETAVDLVVTDVDMPRVSGIELVRRIRATSELERLPVVLVTSLGDEADRRRGAEAGADAYIVKGEFDQDDLLRAVARLT